MIPGQYPPGFEHLTYEIKSDQPIPFIRKDQRQTPYPEPKDKQIYPIHKKSSIRYNLFTALDNMRIKQHIEIKDYYHYTFAVTCAQTYAAKLRKGRPPVQMYLRTEWHQQQQIGRIWRLG